VIAILGASSMDPSVIASAIALTAAVTMWALARLLERV
jgi:hypothetical protein